jgi:hypothetical protein
MMRSASSIAPNYEPFGADAAISVEIRIRLKAIAPLSMSPQQQS